MAGVCFVLKPTKSALKTLQGDDIRVHWERGGDRIQSEGNAKDEAHLENSFTKNRYLLTWAPKITKSRKEVSYLGLLSVFSVFVT